MEAGLEVAATHPLRAFALEVAFTVRSGRCLALTGPSGAGKTSVLRVVAGLLEPEHGRVRCGQETWLDTAAGIARTPDERRCGYLFQSHALFPTMTALDNVAYGLGRSAGGRGERRRRAHEWMERLGIDALARARPATLSGGESQRVALARALAPEPDVLLLDEPLSALDANTRARAARVLVEALAATEVPALLVTHDFVEAAELADEIAVIAGGQILQRGTAAQLATAPASPFVADLTGATVLTGVAGEGPEGLTAIDLEGGGRIFSSDAVRGPVAASVFPWEIALHTGDVPAAGSPRNRLRGRIVTVTPIGNRTRIELAVPQPLAVEVTGAAAGELALEPGAELTATWKATATRALRRT